MVTTLYLTFNIYSVEVLGVDSGNKSIFLYTNSVKTSTAILIIGGIHGDEGETVQVVDYLRKQCEEEKKISLYFIPSINPTLYAIAEDKDGSVKEVKGRRGYISDHLDEKGFIKPGSKLTDFDKKTFYRIFYGSDNTYNNVIGYYLDPNRDFIDRKLPSTRLLISFMNKLEDIHTKVVLLSFHGYMTGGRIYPEYRLLENNVVINQEAWDIAKLIGKASGYIEEKIYPPSVPIIRRFEGELISYTGNKNKIIGLDIELDKNHHTDNKKSSLDGLQALIKYLSEISH